MGIPDIPFSKALREDCVVLVVGNFAALDSGIIRAVCGGRDDSGGGPMGGVFEMKVAECVVLVAVGWAACGIFNMVWEFWK